MAGKLLPLMAFTAALLAPPAGAQPFAEASLRKTDAILGEPSRLAMLVAQQSGRTVAAAAPVPSGLGVLRFARPATQQAVAADRPNVFGTVALRVARTPLDRRWQRVRHARVNGPVGTWARGLAGLAPEQRAETINRFVNQRISFTDDSAQYGAPDVWQSAGDTLRRRRGDCEDYAIAKLQLLRQSGVAAGDLYLVIVKDLVRRADHAVLVVRTGDRLLLLDNATDRVADATAFQDYRPMLSYAANGRDAWTHGYQRSPLLAAAQPAAPPATAAEGAALR